MGVDAQRCSHRACGKKSTIGRLVDCSKGRGPSVVFVPAGDKRVLKVLGQQNVDGKPHCTQAVR